MTILTANIAYGFPGMDRLFSSIRHQLHIHGWGALTYELFPALNGTAARVSRSKRIKYVKRHQKLDRTFAMIKRCDPDILVLNEVIYELNREELECSLQEMGFRTIAWGISTHYPGTTISTLIAAKAHGTSILCRMPQRPSMGGGAGMAGIRLDEVPLSIFGVHLTYRSPVLFGRQMQYISEVAADETALGNEVLIAGDWNEYAKAILDNSDFKSLGLVPAVPDESVTCPTFLPGFLRKPLDHVFIPLSWRRITSRTIAFGSDHLALQVEVDPRSPLILSRRHVDSSAAKISARASVIRRASSET